MVTDWVDSLEFDDSRAGTIVVAGIVPVLADYYSTAVEGPADEVIDLGSLIADLSLHHWVSSFYCCY